MLAWINLLCEPARKPWWRSMQHKTLAPARSALFYSNTHLIPSRTDAMRTKPKLPKEEKNPGRMQFNRRWNNSPLPSSSFAAPSYNTGIFTPKNVFCTTIFDALNLLEKENMMVRSSAAEEDLPLSDEYLNITKSVSV